MRELALWGARSLGPPTVRDELFEGWLANAMDIVMAPLRAGRPLRVPGRPGGRLARRRRGRGRPDRRPGRRRGGRPGGDLLPVRGPVPRRGHDRGRPAPPRRAPGRRAGARRDVRRRPRPRGRRRAFDGSDAGGLLQRGELGVEVGQQALQVRHRTPAAGQPERHLVGVGVAGDVQRHPVDRDRQRVGADAAACR